MVDVESDSDSESPFDTSNLRDEVEDVSDSNLSDVILELEEYEHNKNRQTEKFMEVGSKEDFPCVSEDVAALLAAPDSPPAASRPQASVSSEDSVPSLASIPSLVNSTTTGDSGNSSDEPNSPFLAKDAVKQNFEGQIHKFIWALVNMLFDRLQEPSKTSKLGSGSKAAQELQEKIGLMDFNPSPTLATCTRTIYYYHDYYFINPTIPELVLAQGVCIPVY